jgi:hypothetical protein
LEWGGLDVVATRRIHQAELAVVRRWEGAEVERGGCCRDRLHLDADGEERDD